MDPGGDAGGHGGSFHRERLSRNPDTSIAGSYAVVKVVRLSGRS